MEYIIRFSVNLFDLGMFWYYLNSFKKMKSTPKILFVMYIMAMAAIWSGINALNYPFLNLLTLVSVLLITSLFFESTIGSRLVTTIVIILEDTHEPIVSYELYVKANTMFRQMEFRLSGKTGKNIYHCGHCGRKMQKDSKGGIRCNQRYLLKECKCRSAVISIEEADKTVLLSLKKQIRLFVKEAELSGAAKNKTILYSEGAEIATLIKSIATMKKTWMPLYEQYTDGKLSREDFLVEKKYDEETARLEQRLHELQSKQELQQENEQQIEKNISQLNCYADQMELTEEIKEKLIDKVNVYSDNKIEICWNFDSGFFDLETMHKCG